MTSFGSFDLIIFDWDGTLFDSVTPIIDLIDDATLDNPVTEQAQQLKQSGLLPVLKQIIAGEHAVQVLDLKLLLNLEGLQTFRKKNGLYDGIAELLATLHASGQKMAVVAGRPQDDVLAEINRLGISDYFITVLGSDQGSVKPNPSLLHSILSLSGCDVSRALLVGDSTLDMEMATLARMSMLGVAYITRNHDPYCLTRLPPWQPLAIATSVAELSQILQNNHDVHG